jgi:hypothetical protein
MRRHFYRVLLVLAAAFTGDPPVVGQPAAEIATLALAEPAAEEADAPMLMRVYPVMDLLTPPSAQRYTEAGAAIDSLSGLVTGTVARVTWSDVGGTGELTAVPDRGVLVCKQTAAVHEQIECLVAALRQARNEQFPNARVRLPAVERKEQRVIAELRRALASPVTLKCDSSPVRDFARQIASMREIPVVVDARIEGDVKVSVDVAGVLLSRALYLALDPVGLDAGIYDGAIFIAPGSSESWQDYDTRVYPVWDLVRARDATEERVSPDLKLARLVQTIRQCVQPNTWEEVGGPHQVTPFANAGAFVVSQTSFGHDELSQLLSQLREAEHQEPPTELNPAGRLERALRQSVEFDFRNMPLSEAAEQIRRQSEGRT